MPRFSCTRIEGVEVMLEVVVCAAKEGVPKILRTSEAKSAAVFAGELKIVAMSSPEFQLPPGIFGFPVPVRRRWIFAFATIIVMTTVGGGMWFLAWDGGLSMPPIWFLLAGPGYTIMVVTWMGITGWRDRKVARQQDFELCMHCGYPLRGLSDGQACSECSKPVDRAESVARWKHYCKLPWD